MSNPRFVSVNKQIIASSEALKKQPLFNKLLIPIRPAYNKIQQDYFKYLSHIEFQLNTSLPVHILPYCEEYYVIDMTDEIFPIFINLKNFKGVITLFVGYNKKYPSQRLTERISTINQQEKISASYDQKYQIQQDKTITLNNPTAKFISKVYLGISTSKKMSFFTLSITSKSQNIVKKKKKKSQEIFRRRIQTQHIKQFYKVKKNQQSIKKTSQLDFPKIKSVERVKSFKNHAKSVQVEKNKYQKSLKKINMKNYLNDAQKQLIPTGKRKKTEIQQEKSVQRFVNVKNNKLNLQLLKQKQQEFKELSSQTKSLISDYQMIIKKQKQKKIKITTVITPLIYLLKFIKVANQNHQSKEKAIVRAWRVNYITSKFVRKIRRKNLYYKKLIPHFSKRILMPIYDYTRLNAKTLYKCSLTKAGNLLYKLFNDLSPGLILNKVFDEAVICIRKISKIQKSWKIKYHNRLSIIKICAIDHVKKMMVQHYHFINIFDLFQSSMIIHKVCCQYLKDECIKFQQIYLHYKQFLQQRDQYIKMNEQIIKHNKKNRFKLKQLLSIPNKPTKPCHRFFRDLDILKTMLRNWFEIQYKRWQKLHPSY